MSNFAFLKNKNENFFKIISEAEKLFRDEYFEQAVVQTRRFAENICRDLLQNKVLPDDTFDSMINKIKDNSFGNTRMKEFTEDLYFLKKYGNISAHSSKSSITPDIALECIERAHEISIFYSHMKYGVNKKLEKVLFSEEVLMTGKQSSPKPLKDRYLNELKQEKNKNKSTKSKNTKKSKPISRSKSAKKKPKKKSKFFKLKLLFILMLLIFLGCLFYEYGFQH